jgi:hypothetical protein
MTIPPSRTTLASILLLAATASAQTLIAPTRNTQSIHQSVHATCTPLGTCTTTLPPQNPALNFWPGGSAWDGTSNSLWVSTGQMIERRSVAPCGLTCPQVLCPKSSLAAEVMGMDINELTNELWILDSAGVVTRCANDCSLAVQGSFSIPSLAVVNNNGGTGVAIDEVNGLVFYSSSDFGGSGSAIHCALLATPTVIFQVTPMTICFGTLITGIAVHPGLPKLYVTNGRETFDWNYSVPSPGTVIFAAGACCTGIAPPGDPYIDLSIRWAPPVPMGEPCASGSCPPCGMVHVLRNSPVLNTNLQLGLDFAPPGIPVWCLINIGSCVAGGPVIPPLCGPLYVPLGAALTPLGPAVTVGTPCNASATIVLPLVGPPSLIGLPLATQFVGLCTPGIGTTMSNCLSWVVQ